MTQKITRITNIIFAVLLAVFSVNLSGVLSLQTAQAAANNGTLKVHEQNTPSGTESNDPKVCAFNLEGFNFDAGQDGYVVFKTQPGGVSALTIPFGPASGSGYYATSYINDGGLTLADGQYKATLYGKDTGNPAQPNLQDEKAKSKVFKVDCAHIVTPVAPAFTDLCGDAGDTYTLPTTTGVTYQVKINFGFFSNKAAGTHNVTDGDTITVKAVANNGYTLIGTTQWSYNFSADDCTVTPATPTNIDLCGTANDTYTIPVTIGVTYQIKVGNSWVNKPAGTYTGSSTVEIRAIAKPGYDLAGSDSNYKWTFNFSSTACPVSVTPTAPTKIDLCGKANDTYTIPSTTGVTYKVNGNTKAAGTYQTNGDVVITAHANPGYVLTGTISWNFDFNQHDCPVTATPPTKVELCGTVNDTYTIPTTEHVKYYKLVWLIPIELSAGTYQSNGNDVTIIAFADSGYDLKGQHVWHFDFSKQACPEPCHPSADSFTALTFWHHDDEEVPCIPVPATPAAPSSVDLCGIEDDEYTIPSTTGVIYKVNGTIKAAGTYSANGASVIITAEAAPGYVLNGTDEWTFDFTNEDCPVEPCTPTMVSALSLSILNDQVANDDNCPPGQGGAGGETPTPKTAVPAGIELPQTGADGGNALAKAFTLLVAGMTTYGIMFFLINRRELAKK